MERHFLPHRTAVAAAIVASFAASGAYASADLSVSDATTPAGRRATMSFTVTRSGDTNFGVSVGYSTSDGTAKAGTDYTATSGTLNFGAGETIKTVNVPVLDKFAPRPKSFKLNLANAAVLAPPLAFGGAGQQPGPGQFIFKAVSADFNGDGKPDLAAIGANGLQIDRNDTPAGATVATFTSAYTSDATDGYYDMAIADINGDGKPDIVLANAVLLNTTPAFSPVITFAVSSLPVGARDITVGDFDKDGRIDIAAIDNTGAKLIHILRNTTAKGATTPTFTAAADVPIADLPVGGGPVPTIVAGDFDGDGKLDLATVSFTGFNVLSHLNTTPAGGPITFGAESAFGVPEAPAMLAVGDFNGDGKADIVTANIGTAQTGVSFTVLTSKATAGSGTPAFSPFTFYGYAPQSISVADMDGDGRPDLVTGNGYNLQGQGGGSVLVWLNNTAKGATTPAFQTPIQVQQGAVPYYTVPFDFNGDGLLDIASSDIYFGSTIAIDFQKKVSATPGTAKITDGNGNGTITSRDGH